MSIQSLHGDVLDLLSTLAPGSVQSIITSPPYYNLRAYAIPPSDWPEVTYQPLIGLPPVVIPAMLCQLGAEPDPLAYIGHLVHVFRLARPALRDDGTLWVNLGDSFTGSGVHMGCGETSQRQGRSNVRSQGSGVRLSPAGIPDKNLLGIPHRAALALQADGWVWRSECIWHAPNKMPESVRDRPTRAHEQILLFGNGPRYYYDAEAVAEQATEPVPRRTWAERKAAGEPMRRGTEPTSQAGFTSGGVGGNGSTRNRRSVWSIVTTPMPANLRGASDAHYAAWPPALVEIMIKASTCNRACSTCGAAWVRQVERGESDYARLGKHNGVDFGKNDHGSNGKGNTRTANGTTPSLKAATVVTTGFAPACACEAGVGRCVVLDVFAGTGTTMAVAESLGRDSIGIDLGYQSLQSKRTDNLQISMDAFV